MTRSKNVNIRHSSRNQLFGEWKNGFHVDVCQLSFLYASNGQLHNLQSHSVLGTGSHTNV